jgi:eukaryotic translation initiation factor 2C
LELRTDFARTSFNVPEQRCTVNLDEEQGRQPGPKGPDIVFFVIRPTKTLRMASLEGYLNKKTAFDNSVLECINFLDHVVRMSPSLQLFVASSIPFPTH